MPAEALAAQHAAVRTAWHLDIDAAGPDDVEVARALPRCQASRDEWDRRRRARGAGRGRGQCESATGARSAPATIRRGTSKTITEAWSHRNCSVASESAAAAKSAISFRRYSGFRSTALASTFRQKLMLEVAYMADWSYRVLARCAPRRAWVSEER